MLTLLDTPDLPPNPQFPYKLSAADKRQVRKALTALTRYNKELAGGLSEDGFQAMSLANKVIWGEIEQQQELLEEILATGEIAAPDGWEEICED